MFKKIAIVALVLAAAVLAFNYAFKEAPQAPPAPPKQAEAAKPAPTPPAETKAPAPAKDAPAQPKQPASEPEVKTDSGRYVGLIDNNSIEIEISGVPKEKAARAFRLTDEIKPAVEKLSTGDQVKFQYFINKDQQNVLKSIERIKN